jgi:hypothetical protein
MARTVKFACDLVKILGGALTLIHVVVLSATTASSMPKDPARLEGEVISMTASHEDVRLQVSAASTALSLSRESADERAFFLLSGIMVGSSGFELHSV